MFSAAGQSRFQNVARGFRDGPSTDTIPRTHSCEHLMPSSRVSCGSTPSVTSYSITPRRIRDTGVA
jgi:hypothetical protein